MIWRLLRLYIYMLTKDQAVLLASNFLGKRGIEFRLYSVVHAPGDEKNAGFMPTVDCWIVRFAEVLPPGVADIGLTTVAIECESGSISLVPGL